VIRVIHLLPTFLQDHGPSNVVLNLLKVQQPHVEWTAVWSMRTPCGERDPKESLAELNVDVRSLRMSEDFLDPRVLWRLVRELLVLRPDILHCHLVRANLYGRIAAHIANVPVVVNTLHNTEAYYTSSAIHDRLVNRIEGMTQEMVTAFVAVSESAKDSYLRAVGKGDEKIAVIQNGVELPSSQPTLTKRECRDRLGLPDDVFLVVSVGRLHKQKNYAMLIRCAEIIRERGQKIVWAIAGDGPEKAELLKEIERRSLDGTVRLMGHLSNISLLLKSADAFVLTSRYEGLPMALLEAMAHGIPCLSTDVGGVSGVNVDGMACSLVQVDADEEFVREILLFVTDRERRLSQGHLAHDSIQRYFSSEVMANKYTSLYRSLMT